MTSSLECASGFRSAARLCTAKPPSWNAAWAANRLLGPNWRWCGVYSAGQVFVTVLLSSFKCLFIDYWLLVCVSATGSLVMWENLRPSINRLTNTYIYSLLILLLLRVFEAYHSYHIISYIIIYCKLLQVTYINTMPLPFNGLTRCMSYVTCRMSHMS